MPVNTWLMPGDNASNSGTDAEFQSKMFNFDPDMLHPHIDALPEGRRQVRAVEELKAQVLAQLDS